MNRWHRRRAEIDARLAEITDKEFRLYKVVKESPPAATGADNRPGRGNVRVPLADASGPRLRPTEFSYE